MGTRAETCRNRNMGVRGASFVVRCRVAAHVPRSTNHAPLTLRYSLGHMKILIAMGAIAALPAFAQDQAIQELTKHWATSKTFTLAVANAMPDANYAFKATP